MHKVDSSYRTAFMIMSFVQYKTGGLMMIIVIRTRWSTWLESVCNSHFSAYTNTKTHTLTCNTQMNNHLTVCIVYGLKKFSFYDASFRRRYAFVSLHSSQSQSYEQNQLKWSEKRPVAVKSEPDSIRKQSTRDKIRMKNKTKATNQQNVAGILRWKRKQFYADKA